MPTLALGKGQVDTYLLTVLLFGTLVTGHLIEDGCFKIAGFQPLNKVDTLMDKTIYIFFYVEFAWKNGFVPQWR